MSYWKQIQVVDDLAFNARCTPTNELRTVIPTRIAGQVMQGAQVDPNFWTTSAAGTGAAAQSNGLQTLTTGATANSSIRVSSTELARFVGQNENLYSGVVQMGDTGTTNNTRRWGAFNGTDGAYFKLAGMVLSIATVKGGVETAVASTSWNRNQTVPTLTNINTYRVEYRLKAVIFEINGVVVHVASTASSLWANTSNLNVWHDNVNSGGSTSNVSMSVAAASIYRMGPFETQPKYVHLTGNGTTVAKYGAGILHRVIINTLPNSGSSTLTIYDNTAGSGTTLAVVTGGSTGGPISLEYQASFNTGLTLVSAGTAWDLTIVYQ